MNRYRWVVGLAGVCVAVVGLTAGPAVVTSLSMGTAANVPASGGGHRWVTAWGANPVVGVANPYSTCPAGTGLQNQTVRNVVFASTGGSAVRVRLTNTFGTKALHVGSASVALQASNADVVPGTTHQLTFAGRTDVTIAAGGEYLSDPVAMTVPGLRSLLVSVYLPDATGPVTHHPFTAQGNFLGTGDLTLSATGAGYANTPCWMFVDGVDVRAADRVVGTVVALGDSITDTSATTGNANKRWPDDLARRLAALRGRTLSVANAGLGGDRLLASRPDGDFWGLPVLARLDHDVYAQTAATDVIMLIGVNDIGFDATAPELIAGLQQVAVQTHAQGLRIFGGTIGAFGGSFLDNPQREATRLAVNAWIRSSHVFDGVVDFAAALADPANPHALRPAYDSGDHLHPNDAGCQAMADAVDLRALLR
jgi:lysophospholipase L1-like esterase